MSKLTQLRHTGAKIVRNFLNNDFSQTNIYVSGHRLSDLQAKTLQSKHWRDTPLDSDDAQTILEEQAMRSKRFQTEADSSLKYHDRAVVLRHVSGLKLFSDGMYDVVFGNRTDGFIERRHGVDPQSTVDVFIENSTQKLANLASKKFERHHGYKPSISSDGILLDDKGEPISSSKTSANTLTLGM